MEAPKTPKPKSSASMTNEQAAFTDFYTLFMAYPVNPKLESQIREWLISGWDMYGNKIKY
jgi:hypothetical protein